MIKCSLYVPMLGLSSLARSVMAITPLEYSVVVVMWVDDKEVGNNDNGN